MQKLKKLAASEYFLSDTVALALGAFLCLLLLFTAKYGIGMTDEGYYYTVAHRLMHGERMIADEWNLAQLVHLLNLLPNCLYMKLTGGTEGLILFMRYLFVGIITVYYSYVYVKLRKWKLWGAAAAFLFCAVIQQILLTIAYFTAAPMAMLAFWLMTAADEKKKSAPKLFLAGIILACGILAEPFLIVIYALWFVLTLLRGAKAKKQKPFLENYSFILDKKIFWTATIGAVSMFVPYMLYLFLSGSFSGIGDAVPYLTTGAEYNKSNIIDLQKFVNAADLYGFPFLAGITLVPIAALIVRLRKNSSVRLRRTVFLCAFAVLAAGYVCTAFRLLGSNDEMRWASFTQYNNLPLLLFSAAPWLLSKKKNPRLFVLWLTGILFSVLVDISSTVILASGGGLLRVACVLQISELVQEFTAPEQTDKKTKKAKKQNAFLPVKIILSVCGAAAIMWNTGYLMCETVYKPVEKLFLHVEEPLSVKIEKGPFRGLVTTDYFASVYNETLKDLDEVKEIANGRPVTVLDLAPYTYLYMDLPYGSYSSWYEFDEPERLAAYWGLRPAQKPAAIYVPYYNKNEFKPYTEEYLEKKLEDLCVFVDGEIQKGRAGYIIKIVRLRTSANAQWEQIG